MTKILSPEEREKMRADTLLVDNRKHFKLEDFHKIDKSRDFIEKLQYNVKLRELYELMDSCNYNESNEWSPVLLKVSKKLQTLITDQEEIPDTEKLL